MTWTHTAIESLRLEQEWLNLYYEKRTKEVNEALAILDAMNDDEFAQQVRQSFPEHTEKSRSLRMVDFYQRYSEGMTQISAKLARLTDIITWLEDYSKHLPFE